MKKLIPAVLALLFLICSCSSKKSFLTQRYTNFKHKRSAVAVENRPSHATKATKAAPVAVENTAVDNHAVAKAEPVTAKTTAAPKATNTKLLYTRAAVKRVILPSVLKGKEQVTDLFASGAKQPVKLTKTKSLNLDQNQDHQKRGLLWGVIDAILALILLVVFVILVAWLILIIL